MIVPRSTIYKQKIFCLFFCITIFFPIHSNISQNNTKMLKEQQQEMQQWLLTQLEKVVKLCQAEHAAQKAREEAKKRRVVKKKKKKKKRILEYLQQLQNKILAEDAKRFQIAESKHKEVFLGDDRDYWPFKKAKGKQLTRYYRDLGVKIGVLIPVKGVCILDRTDYLVHNSR